MNRNFTDRHGRTWTVPCTLAAFDAAAAAGNDPLAWLDDDHEGAAQSLAAFVSGPRVVLAVVEAMLATEPGFSRDEMRAGVDGPALQRAVDAVVGAASDFFQSPAKTAILKRAVESVRAGLALDPTPHLPPASAVRWPTSPETSAGNSPAS